MKGAIAIAALLVLAASRSPAQELLSGRVTDATTGRPIAGAEVRVLGAPGGPRSDSARAVTNEWGAWRARGSGTEVAVRALGFQPRRVPVAAATEIALTPVALALDRVVVTAAKREQTLAQTVVTTEVVSRDDIARTGASDLGSALIAATGIELAGGVPAGAGVMLQGMSSARVLILLDGHPLPGRIGGDFDLSRIPTANVERVEVVKGPQSSLYGTDAMGGVVNIITRAPAADGPAITASATMGSRERLDASLSADAALGAVALRGDAGRRSIATTPGRAGARGSLSRRLDASASLAWAMDRSTTLDAAVQGLDERQRWLGGSLYNFGDNLQLTARAQLARSLGGGDRMRVSLFGSSYDHLSRASSQPQPIRGDTGQRQVQRLAQAELAYSRVMGRHTVDAGLLGRRDDTESARIPGGRRGLTTIEPSLQHEWAMTRGVSLVTGARVSRSERWGTHFTPRVAARWVALPRLTLRASAGAGFRAPDFRELYMRFSNESAGYAVHGSDQLRPEHSRNVSAGAEWVADAGFARVQLFHNDFSHFIEPTLISAPGEPMLLEYRNVAHGYTRGVEAEGAAALRGLRMDGGVALLEARDRDTGLRLLGRPAVSSRATLSHPLPLGARGALSASYTGRTAMQREGGVTSWRDAYARLDARLARAAARDMEVTFNVENVLDRRPALWAGFTGRQYTLGLSWRRGL